MQSYPFTSQVTYDEQDLPVYDRAIDSAFLREVFAQYFSDGIFYKPANAFQVLAGTGMNILVNPGAGHIQGAIGIEKAQRTLAIQASEASDRIDTVVLRLDLSLVVRNIDLYVVKGTASSAPQAPALTRNSTVWELGLANIFVAKNTTSVTQQRITDTRLDNSRCGVVAQTIGELDTSPYFEQIQAMMEFLSNQYTVEFNDWFEEMKGQLTEDAAGNLQTQIDAITNSRSQPNGLATLNSSGKLAQMPTAADVGAVPVSRTVNGKALSSNITLTAADVGAVPLASIALPNLLLNSDFGVNQRGQTSYSKGRYTADRWYNSSAGTVTIAASTLPNGTAKNMLVISQQASQNTVSQPMENLDSVLGQELTACFWAKAAKAGQMRVGIANDIDTVLNVTTAWKKFTVSLNPTARNSSIWTVDGLFFQSAVSSAALGTLYIAEPQLVYGSFAGVYTPPNPAEELVKCQRYYQRLYDTADNNERAIYPATVQGSGSWIAMGWCPFKATMRAVPQMVYHLDSSLSTSGLAASTNGIDVNKPGFEEGEAFVLKYEADAEIYS